MRKFTRILSIALTLTLTFCLIACSDKTTTESPASTPTDEQVENVISMDKRYKLVDTGKNGQLSYTYTLYDSYGDVVHEQTVAREPKIKYISDNVMEICNSHGTSALSCVYFDLTTNKLSDVCWNPSYVDENVIVYMEYDESRNPSTFLVVKDIFDNNKLYKEYEYDFSPKAVPADVIKSVRRIDNDTLEIVYLKGKNEVEYTTKISLK